MSGKRPIVQIAADSLTKDLPIGKPGFRWQSGSRLSNRLTKSREHRQVLKENQTRYDLRVVQNDKKMAITKESKQFNVFPMPRHKESKFVVDHEAEFRKLAIHPKTVTISEGDLTKITPEVLPLLGQKIQRLRSTGQSWANITLFIMSSYTSHLTGTLPIVFLPFFFLHRM